MTDLDKLKTLLNEFNIEYKEDIDKQTTTITLEAKRGDVRGYYDFVCDWEFTNEEFDNVGIWE